jgi:hypothetical protein
VRLIRSFPASVPHGRSYVVDDAERFYNADCSYRGLAAYGDDLIHLDWDQAVDREHLVEFAKICRQEPARAASVPCRLREVPDLPERWNAYRYEPGGQSMRQCTPADSEVDLWGFGMVYLPFHALAEFEETFAAELDAGTVRFGDTAFSGWYYRRFGPARLVWTVRCVHLHYKISEVPL